MFERPADGVVPTQAALTLRNDAIDRTLSLNLKATELGPLSGTILFLVPRAIVSLRLLPRMVELTKSFTGKRF